MVARSGCMAQVETCDRGTLLRYAARALIDRVPGGFAIPGDGTFLATWLAWADRGCPTPGLSGLGRLKRYRLNRKILQVEHLPHPDVILLELILAAKPRQLNRRFTRDTIGYPLDQAVDRALQLDDVVQSPVRTRAPLDCRVQGNVHGTTLRKLTDWGVIEFDGRRYVLPGEGTFRAVWKAWVDAGCPTPGVTGRERLSLYRRIRQVLRVKHISHPDVILLEVMSFTNGRRVSRKLTSALVGEPVKRAVRRMEMISGSGRKEQSPWIVGSMDDLLALLPPETHGRITADLAKERVPPVRPPTPQQIGRVTAIGSPPLRLLAATLLLAASSNRVGQSTTIGWIRKCERYAEMLPAGGEQSPTAVGWALESYLAGAALPLDRDAVRAITASDYASALNLAHAYLVRVVGEDAAEIAADLPARQVDEGTFTAKAREARTLSRVPERTKRVEQVKDLVPRMSDVLIACENRVAQVEWMAAACLASVASAAARLDAGLDAGFEHEGPVIEADGRLGTDTQIVSFAFKREGDLLEKAYRINPSDALSKWLRPGFDGLPGAGFNHDPERYRRLHVVYLGTRPAAGSSRCVEPWFVDLFRWGMVEPDNMLPNPISQERHRLLTMNGLPLDPPGRVGMLCHDPDRRTAARFARTHDPDLGSILVPLINLYHAATYGRLILRYGMRWGARFGETLQIRLGPDCFRTHLVGGRKEIYLALKPKGWADHGKFGVDVGMLEAIRQVKLFTHARWFPDVFNDKGEPWLPDHRFGDGHRLDLPPAAYIFTGRGGALPPAVLTYIVRVLMVGVIQTTRHVDRIVFATMLGLDGVSYEPLGVLLHHRPGSRMPSHYDLSPLIASSAPIIKFNSREDAQLIGMAAGA